MCTLRLSTPLRGKKKLKLNISYRPRTFVQNHYNPVDRTRNQNRFISTASQHGRKEKGKKTIAIKLCSNKTYRPRGSGACESVAKRAIRFLPPYLPAYRIIMGLSPDKIARLTRLWSNIKQTEYHE